MGGKTTAVCKDIGNHKGLIPDIAIVEYVFPAIRCANSVKIVRCFEKLDFRPMRRTTFFFIHEDIGVFVFATHYEECNNYCWSQ